MSPTRRSFLKAVTGAAAATAITIPAISANTVDDFSPLPVPEFEHTNDFKDHEDLIMELADYVRAQIKARVVIRHQQMAFSGVANYVLDSAINVPSPWADLYGDTGEPPQSIIDRVLTMFSALCNGQRDMLDVSYPPQEYNDWIHMLHSVEELYGSEGRDPIGMLGDAGQDLACACLYNGARIGAHLTEGLMNAMGRNYGRGFNHPIAMERYRYWGSDTAQDERFGLT
jgi:hypothetical protein